jgi:adenylate cyclase
MLGDAADSATDLLAGIERRLWLQCTAANLAGAALAAVSGALTSANIAHQPGFGRIDLITLCLYLALAAPLGGAWVSRLSKRPGTWLLEGRPPTAAEQREVLAGPWKFTVVTMLGWLGAAVIWSGLAAASHGGAYVVRVALSIVLGGLATSGLIYLVVEWTLRPVTALALASNVPDRPVVAGVRAKLALSWAVGADVFLIMVGLAFLGRPAHEPPSPAAIWFIVGAGLVAGSLVLYVATRSLANPLVELRHAVGRVQRGDVELDVPVDDGGELGLLQAGFNQMVAGLRERRVLEDLFGHHVGEEVARQAAREGVALRGARCQVGVVFVDLVGSTSLAQSRG